ncbi:MAG: glutamate-cysteine ligase family protein [Bdellovibrio sp.]
MDQRDKKDFHYGLELEYLLMDKNSAKPLWYQDVTFKELNACFESISLEGIPSLAGLELEAPHKKNMPYIVEGYHVPDEHFNMVDMLPKGVEIRTPVVNSVEKCLHFAKILFDRLQSGLNEIGYSAVALSHHPLYSEFSGQQNKRRHDFWQWAMEVMTTYGPDINVSLPEELSKRLDLKDLEAKVNYYAPAMAAFSLASPFVDNSLWKIREKYGKSFRTHKRSYIAPPIEIHPDEGFRLEFKVFEMSPHLQDYQNFFLLFLTLLLDENLKGRASKQTRIYDLGNVAQFGFNATEMSDRAAALLQSAFKVLPQWGFSADPLKDFVPRFERKRCPADDMIEKYLQTNDLKEILLERAQLNI